MFMQPFILPLQIQVFSPIYLEFSQVKCSILSFYCTVLFTGYSAKKRFSIATILQNCAQASPNALSVKSDLFCSNLIRENIKKRFITLSSSKPVKLVS